MSRPLFAYGTLRRGFGNHAAHLAGVPYLGAARTADPMALHVRADGIPMLARIPARHHVVGELYAVDDATLAAIDALEGHPTWYRREPVVVVRVDGGRAGEVLTAWAYLVERPDGRIATTGDYAEAARGWGRGRR